MSLVIFLFGVFVISFSGALQPGPVTATAITIGARNRHAGAFLAIGHGIIEFPLMVLIMLGADKVMEKAAFQIVVGLAGGAILIMMAVAMFRSAKTADPAADNSRSGSPVLAGIVLSGTNPYFLIWWATIGLGLAAEATGFGIWGFALFAVVHWLCDLCWFELLSIASFKGSRAMSPAHFRRVLQFCSALMLLFGGKFVVHSVFLLDLLLR